MFFFINEMFYSVEFLVKKLSSSDVYLCADVVGNGAFQPVFCNCKTINYV